MATLTFKAGASWFTPNVTTVKRNTITAIDIVDSYVITGNEIDSWDASEDNDGSIMCYVTGTILTIAGNGSGTIKFNADQSYWLYSTDGKDYFKNCTSFTGLSLIDTSNCTTLNRSFRGLEKITALDIGHFDISNVTSLYQTFCYCKKVTSLPIENWDVSNVTTMAYTFYQTGASTLPIENWNVSNVTNLDHTFAHSTSLNNIDLTKWDVSNVTNMNATFCGMKALTSLDLSTWDTSKVTCFPQFVEGCSNLETIYGLENFDTSKSVCFAQMFRGCSKLKELDLSSFDTRNADSGSITSDNGSTSGCTWQMITNTHQLEKITLGKYFTFEGKGVDIVPAEDIGTLPTPSATHIEDADGNWYTEDFAAYAPADVPNLTEVTYYASKKIVNDVIDARVLNYKGLKYVLQSLNTVIDESLDNIDDKLLVFDDRIVATDDGELTNVLPDMFGGHTPDEYMLKAEMPEVEKSDWSVNDENDAAYIKNRTHWTDDDGTVHKIDEKYLPDVGVRSWNDLTDKPFDTITTRIVDNYTLDNPSVDMSVLSSTDEPNYYRLTISDGFSVGDTVVVTWNGQKYSCKAYVLDGTAAVGNSMYMGGGDTGEPFLIGCMAPMLVVITFDTGAVVSIDIEETKKMSGKYVEGMGWSEAAVLLKESDAAAYEHPSFGKVWLIEDAPKLTVGETYTVTYNGNDYNCVCQSAPSGLSEDANAVAMGNFSVAGGDNTGEPFAMMISAMFNRVDVIDLSGASAVKVKIVGEVVHTIDKKYLPSNDYGDGSAESPSEGTTYDFVSQGAVGYAEEDECILPLTTCTMTLGTGLYYSNQYPAGTLKFVTGNLYKVVYDGNVYWATAKYNGSSYIGDSDRSVDGEYPFVVNTTVLWSRDGGTHTLEVYTCKVKEPVNVFAPSQSKIYKFKYSGRFEALSAGSTIDVETNFDESPDKLIEHFKFLKSDRSRYLERFAFQNGYSQVYYPIQITSSSGSSSEYINFTFIVEDDNISIIKCRYSNSGEFVVVSNKTLATS